MDYQKLKRLAILIVILILVILFATNCEKKVDIEQQQQDYNNQQDVSTETPFDISVVEDDNIARDFTNPTEEEEMEAYALYGKDGCYFDEKGLHIKRQNGNEILRTQLALEDNEFLKTIPEIDSKKLDYFEYEENALRVNFKNMSTKEFEKYLKEIKEEYKYPITITETNVVYKAVCSEGHRVTVSYSKNDQKALFEFKIAELQDENV